MRSGNPFLNENKFLSAGEAVISGESMTVTGTMNKIGILFAILAIGVGWTWADLTWADLAPTSGKMIIGLIGGLVFSLITIFKMNWAPYTAPLYAFCEGMLLGGLSSILEARYPGIAIQSVLLTFGIFIVMLALFRFRIIRVTQRMRLAVVAATGGVALFYFVIMILGFFGIHAGFVFFDGPVGVILSLVIIGIATFNLLLDFDFIEQAADAGAPKYMEWYAAFGLMVTLVWLYIEILRLLARSRD
jgi:uncharacterized YccA/Bax inhibitor family protein